jgi:hypothetical protein
LQLHRQLLMMQLQLLLMMQLQLLLMMQLQLRGWC